MNYDNLVIWFDPYTLLDNANIGPMCTDEAHETRLRANAGDTYDEMHLRSVEDQQIKLADAYEENLSVAVHDTAVRMGIDSVRVMGSPLCATESGDGRPARLTVEDAILAVAMQRVEVCWHVPEGRAAGGWSIFRDGMLTFEM